MSNFLRLEGIFGGSGNPGHIGEFDILSAQMGYRIPNQHSAEMPRSGKVIGDISVTRKNEADSSELMIASVNGKIFPNGKITIESEQGIKIIEMNNVSIQSFSADKSTETISLIYEIPT